MAYVAANVGDVTSKVRAFLGDREGVPWNDDVLMPIVAAAMLDLQAALDEIRAFADTNVGDVTNVPISAVPIKLTPLSTPPLPEDFLFALDVWEKPNGASTTLFQPMAKWSSPLPLPVAPLAPTFGVWADYNGGINLTGATQANDLRVVYAVRFATPTSVDGVVPDSAVLALAYKTTSLAAPAKNGAKLGDRYDKLYNDAINQLQRNSAKLKQRAAGQKKLYGNVAANAYGY